MTPFPLSGAIPGILAKLPPPLAPEVLRPDTDIGISGWEAQDDTTTSLYDHVNDQSDTTYVRPQIPGLSECPTTENDNVEFGMSDPSGTPTGGVDTVVMRVRARYNMLIGGTGSATGRFRLREGTTVRATDSGNSLTTSWAWYELSLSSAQIDSVTDWTNLRVLSDADVCVDTLGDEISFEVAEIEITIN